MNSLILAGLVFAGFWLAQHKAEELARLGRWLRTQCQSLDGRKLAVAGGVVLAVAGVVYLGNKLEHLQPQVKVIETGKEVTTPQQVVVAQPTTSAGPFPPVYDPNRVPPGTQAITPLTRRKTAGIDEPDGGPEEGPPKDAGVPKHAGWVDDVKQPDPHPNLPPAVPGRLWSVKAIPSTGEKPNIGRVTLDPDGIRVYSSSHDANNSPLESGVFVTQWRLADGSMVWSNRMNADLPPAFNDGTMQVAVYDAQPIEGLATSQVPGKSTIHPVWMLNHIEGGVHGPIPTFPLAAMTIDGERQEQRIQGVCPRDRDVSGVSSNSYFRNYTGGDYFGRDFAAGLQHVAATTGVSWKVHRHLLGASVDVAALGTAVYTASRLEPRVRVWDRKTGYAAGLYYGHRDAVDFIRTSGARVLTADRHEMDVWSSPRQTLYKTELPQIERTAMAVTPGWDYALIGTKEGTLHFWDVTHQLLIGEPIQAHEGAVQDIAISSDWRRAVTIGADGVMACWGLQQLDPNHEVVSPGTPTKPPPARPTLGEAGPGETPTSGQLQFVYLLPDGESVIDPNTFRRIPFELAVPQSSDLRQAIPAWRKTLVAQGKVPSRARLEALDQELIRLAAAGPNASGVRSNLERSIMALWDGIAVPGKPDEWVTDRGINYVRLPAY